MTIVLISCVSQKLNHSDYAEKLYTSSLFKKSLAYAKSLKPNKIFILSAKYGLVNLNDKKEPYDVTLNKMTVEERKKWAKKVICQLNKTCNLNEDHFIILAGKKYREFLVKHLKSYCIPMNGLTIGKQLNFLSKKLKNNTNNIM